MLVSLCVLQSHTVDQFLTVLTVLTFQDHLFYNDTQMSLAVPLYHVTLGLNHQFKQTSTDQWSVRYTCQAQSSSYLFMK